MNHLVTVDSAEEARVIPLFLSEVFAGEQWVIPTGLH